MQKFRKTMAGLLRDKGYFMLLLLGVAAIGACGWLLCTTLMGREEPAVLPASVQQDTPEQIRSEASAARSAAETERALSAAREDPEAPVLNTEPPQQNPAPTTLRTVVPVEGSICLPYSMAQLCYHETTKDWRTHDGMDLAAETGTPVRAAADGTVEAVYTDDFLGCCVTLRHEGGYVTRYANLAEEIGVEVGQQVSAGDPLGSVGQTALLEIGEEPHLHFSVTKNNVSIDPERFLSGGTED